MPGMENIKLAFERNAKALTLKPSLGLGTGISKTRIKNGLTCEIEEGNWKLLADMPASVGGGGQAPTPGVYGRAALGSCLAITYMMYAAKMDIPIKMLEVEVQADYNDGALLGTTDVTPGYSEVRYIITIESEAAEKDILKMLDEADERSPYLDVFSQPQTCSRKINIISSKSNS
jgi:uncharacterized OsmC-like protein